MLRRLRVNWSLVWRTKHTLSSSSGNIRPVVSGLFGVTMIVLAMLVWLNRQYMSDFIDYSRYTPTSDIAAIAARTAMNDTGKFYFYVGQPSLDGTQKFNQECDRKETGSAILGCYTNNRIYLYDVADAQLDGIKEVTAVHETLHVIYQRMSDADKAIVDPLLEQEFEKRKDDKELSERMAFYARHEAGERYNELHSIAGTEFSDIDPVLERHYAKYFSKRQTIVALHNKYADVFNSLKARADQLYTQLQNLGDSIKAQSDVYNNQVKILNQDIDRFNSRAAAGSFVSQAVFQAERAKLVAAVAALEAKRGTVTAELARYESLRAQYNATVDASKQLYESIDSSLAPAPSV